MTAAYDRKGHAPGTAPGAGPPPSAAGRRSENAEEKIRAPVRHRAPVPLLPALRRELHAAGGRHRGGLPGVRAAPLHALRRVRRDRAGGRRSPPVVGPNPLPRVRRAALLHLPRVRGASRARLDRLPRRRLRPDRLLVVLGRLGRVLGMRGVLPRRRPRGGRGRGRAPMPQVRRETGEQARPPLLVQAGADIPSCRRGGRERARAGDRAGDGRGLAGTCREGHPRGRRERLPLFQARLESRRRRRTRHPPGEPRDAPVTGGQGALALDMRRRRGRGHEATTRGHAACTCT